MRVLVTNDDGVHAPGIAVLARAMADEGLEVVVAAPDRDMSGSAAAIGNLGPHARIATHRVELPGAEDLEAHAVEGPPGLAVLAARLGGFGDPVELVVSGINPGYNTGRATLHSGTVGAALTAANFGVSGLAVSTRHPVGDEQPSWDAAAALARAAVAWLLRAPARTVLNLNVPDAPLDAVRGVRWAQLAPFGSLQSRVVAHEAGVLELELGLTTQVLPPDSDTALVEAGYASVSALTGLRVDEWVPAADEIERRALRRSA